MKCSEGHAQMGMQCNNVLNMATGCLLVCHYLLPCLIAHNGKVNWLISSALVVKWL